MQQCKFIGYKLILIMCKASVKVINTPIYLFLYPFMVRHFKLSLSYLKLLNLFILTLQLCWYVRYGEGTGVVCPKRNRICDESVIPSLKAENDLWNIKNIWNKSRSKKRNKEKESRKGRQEKMKKEKTLRRESES